MKTMGLDLSLTSTGYCIDGEAGVIQSKLRGPERLLEISEILKDLIVRNLVTKVAIEGYSFSSRNSQAHSIGELGGVIRVEFFKIGLPVIEIPPTCRAKFATGRGNASKNEVISSVSAKTGIVWSNPGADDKCDAWILEEMLLHKLGRSRFSWPATHVAGLDKVDWSALTRRQEGENENKPDQSG
jgi:Holliday junction resolvasome RuvABC endonuclease subunit